MVAKACFASRQRVSRLSPPWFAFSSLDRAPDNRPRGDDGHIFEVLGRRANHGRAADVDVFDQVTEGDAGLRGGFLKRIEVHDHHVDGLDAVRGDSSLMLGVAADEEQSAMYAGMQRLYAPVQHLREAGQVADVFHRETGFAQSFRGSAGGDQLHSKTRQHLGELHQAGLVRDADQGPLNLLRPAHLSLLGHLPLTDTKRNSCRIAQHCSELMS